jgi:hypothetical protein
MQLEAVKTAAAAPFQTAANYLFSSSVASLIQN